MSAWVRDRGSSNAQLGVYVLTAMRLTCSHILCPQECLKYHWCAGQLY